MNFMAVSLVEMIVLTLAKTNQKILMGYKSLVKVPVLSTKRMVKRLIS